jgi:hypothetical protein
MARCCRLLFEQKFVAFLSQIPPIMPVCPTQPTRKPFAVCNLPESSFHGMENLICSTGSFSPKAFETHIGHISPTKWHLSVLLDTTTERILRLYFEQFSLILNRLANWKAALKRLASARQFRLSPNLKNKYLPDLLTGGRILRSSGSGSRAPSQPSTGQWRKSAFGRS